MEEKRNSLVMPDWPPADGSPQLVELRHLGGEAALAPWVAGQMFINFAETTRDPASFWTPQAYARLRQINAAVDPQDRIRSNHPIPPAVLP